MGGGIIDNFCIDDSSEAVHILIVEDDKDMRNFLKSILNPHYKIILANSADRALAILQERTVDLIVSDVIMPGMNGIDFCRQLKSDIGYSHIPIVILSAKTDLRAKIAGLDAGAEVYLEKPFSGKYL